ncbi:hypothetical protein MBLNU230_g7864t1 [Neophaeotheca triangularis]
MRTTTAALPLAFASPAVAWGALGHATVAYVAQNLVSPSTRHWAQNILNDTSPDYLAGIASWADEYRNTDQGDFTSPFHYINGDDPDPPESCTIVASDCPPEGCVVSAVANYTTRVQDRRLDARQRTNALRFLVHFLGDIAQPLHTEALEQGGNGIQVLYNGTETNLHAIWDTDILEQLRGGSELADARAWGDELTVEIQRGCYRSEKKGWLCELDVEDATATATAWADDANDLVCSAVLPEGVEAVEGDELSGAYYEGVVDVVELQIAKAGYRLAAWLDAIAERSGKGWRHPHGSGWKGFKGWGKPKHDDQPPLH